VGDVARFLGGTGRSGTSLAAERIATHPDVVYFQEPFWFCDRNRQVLAYLRDEVDAEAFKETMRRSLRNVQAGFQEQGDTEMLRRYRAKGVLEDPESVVGGVMAMMDVRSYIERLARVSGRRYWIEKTPHNVRHAQIIARVFPQARIVHVIREPKDICASLLEQHWGPKGALRFAPWYQQVMTDALEAYRAIPRHQYLVIEMETLVRQPHAELGRALRFLEIEYDLEWLHDTAKAIDPTRAHIGRYEVDLSIRAQRLIDAHCGDLYDEWRRVAHGT